MAGATAIGASVARHSVASRSSACPVARRARKSALAGAMSTACAQRASSMWPMAASAAASHRSLRLPWATRSEEHTSELQSPDHLVCLLLLEKKNDFPL